MIDLPSESEFDPPANTSEIEESQENIREQRLQGMLLAALTGELGRDRSLKYWENSRLKPKHLQMLFMAGAGYTNNAIARQFEMTPARVSVILNHPDAKRVLSTLVSFNADNLLDVKARIKAHAGEALDTALEVMRTSRDQRLRAEIGFKILDRAGHGATQRVESVHTFNLPKEHSKGLTEALQESLEIDAEYRVVPKESGRPVASVDASRTGGIASDEPCSPTIAEDAA